MIVLSLGRVGGPTSVPILLGLLDDEDVAGHAIIALGKLRDPRAVPALEPFLVDENTWRRREAKKALRKIKSRPAPSSTPAQ